MTLSSPLKDVIESGSILIIYGGGNSQFSTAQCNGDDIFLSAAVTHQSETETYDVDLAAAGERIDGIVVSQAYPFTVDLDKDSDDCFDDDAWIRYYKPISRDKLYATVTTATSITKDDWVKYTDGFLLGATNKNDAIGKLDNGGVAITAVSAQEQVTSIEWGTD